MKPHLPTRSVRVAATVALSFAMATAAGVVGGARASEVPLACTQDGVNDLSLECLPGGTAGQLLRLACSYYWIEGACDATVFEDPGYATDVEPSPGEPLAWRAGAVHNHSGYSDGDPNSVPRDYFTAARTGHNVADAGGDTGVILDFLFSSEHSDNAQLPVTTAEACLQPGALDVAAALAGLDLAALELLVPPLACAHLLEDHHYWKWDATLRQARETTERGEDGAHTGFTAVRGFEWTNDYFNHLNVFFSTNFTNVKVDGSYLTMDIFWDWLRRPVARGGGADGLVTFNHPGSDPHLTPFDGGLPHTELLAQFPGGGDWNDLAYVPDVDDRVAGMEVNGGDDIAWFVKALTKGWHIGPVAAEDEHQREWSTSADGKTLILTRGRSPQDYYYALAHHRTVAVRDALVGGAPGTPVQVPTIDYYADGDGAGPNAPGAVPLGSVLPGGDHVLHFAAAGLAPGSRVALVSNTTGGQAAPAQLGAADDAGTVSVAHAVGAPAVGEDWYFVVVCAPEAAACGTDQSYLAVTAPLWVAAG